MPRHDRGEIEMKLLQFLESFRILGEVREIEIAELLFENAVPVKNFLLREKHGEMIVTRNLSLASWRKPSEIARTANFVPA